MRRVPGLVAAGLIGVLAAGTVAAAPGDMRGDTRGPVPRHCSRGPAGAQELLVAVDVNGDGDGDEIARGLYAVPRQPPDTLVVYAHGYGHSSESWREHLLDTVERTGAAALAMDYRGTTFGSDDDGDGVRPTRGWRVLEGAEDSIAAARAFEARCGIDTIVLVGVSMGGNAAGLALAEEANDADGGALFDWWVQVEGASNVIETYQGARLLASDSDFAAAAQEDIEQEMGGTFEEVPGTYADHTVVLRVPEIVASGVRGAFVIHAVEDGLVPYNQSVELVGALRGLRLPTDLYTVGTRDEQSEAGTTITGYAQVDSPFTGHASETSTTHLVMRTAFAVVDELVAGTREATDANLLVDGTL